MKLRLLIASALFCFMGNAVPANAQSNAPLLKITPGASQALLAWPTNAAGYVLERANSLVAPINWTAETNNLSVSGTNLTFAISGDAGPLFYRLHRFLSPALPIVAPEETWTWIPFTNAFCMEGTTLGIGVNLNTNSTDLLIYLNGGGACWDDVTCYLLNTATHGPFGQTEFDEIEPELESAWLFDRTTAANPFQNYSYVFVPYCTGDLHAGSLVSLYGTNVTMQVGYLNMAAYLQRLVPTLPGVDHVVIAGSSAGGYGAVYNWSQTRQAFGNVRTDLIDDSGPILTPDVVAEGDGLLLPGSIAATNWNINAALPSGCATCEANESTIYNYIDSISPSNRVALLSYVFDSTIPEYLELTEPQFTNGLQELVTQEFSTYTNSAYFFVNATNHVLLLEPPTLSVNGVTLEQFITEMVTDDPNWISEHP